MNSSFKMCFNVVAARAGKFHLLFADWAPELHFNLRAIAFVHKYRRFAFQQWREILIWGRVVVLIAFWRKLFAKCKSFTLSANPSSNFILSLANTLSRREVLPLPSSKPKSWYRLLNPWGEWIPDHLVLPYRRVFWVVRKVNLLGHGKMPLRAIVRPRLIQYATEVRSRSRSFFLLCLNVCFITHREARILRIDRCVPWFGIHLAS